MGLLPHIGTDKVGLSEAMPKVYIRLLRCTGNPPEQRAAQRTLPDRRQTGN
jgi:hypothetical protein